MGPAVSAQASAGLAFMSRFPVHTTAVCRASEPAAHASRLPKEVPVFQWMPRGVLV